MNKEDLFEIFRKAKELDASDIHFTAGEVPAFRIDGKIIKTKLKPLSEVDMFDIVKYTAPVKIQEKMSTETDLDYSFYLENVTRFRVNIGTSFEHHVATFRLIPYGIRTFQELKLPEQIKRYAEYENGLILVTGVTGSGKSTTIASILEHINQTKQRHIITIEDPVEYVYTNKRSIFTQRQVGTDTSDFLTGLKYALRQDPDVILIGEIRDAETVKSALHAAETGHLVFATLHTYNAIQTINRVLSFFEAGERETIRKQFAELFRGSLSQRLLPKASGHGRIPAVELMFSTPTIKDFILKNELGEIYKLVQKGSYDEMITFNSYLYSLLKDGLITEEVALENSDAKGELVRMLKGAY